jgi:transposase
MSVATEAIIVAFYKEGMSQTEIATKLTVPRVLSQKL